MSLRQMGLLDYLTTPANKTRRTNQKQTRPAQMFHFPAHDSTQQHFQPQVLDHIEGATMNEGSPDKRSPLASYSAVKADDESKRSEKALLRTRRSDDARDATRDSPDIYDDASASSDHSGTMKVNQKHHAPSMAASKAMADIMKEAADGDIADFDMSMVPLNFPQRLHDLLSDEANSDAIAWLPHGKGFVIRNKKIFSDVTLPKYFKEAKFTSFTRKLNRWGFCRVTRGSESGAYYHPYFQKGNLRRTLLMTCTQRSSKKKKQPDVAAANPMAGLLGQVGGDADPLAALRRHLGQTNPALLFGQRNELTFEQARSELLLRQEQEQLAKLEELRRGQRQNLSAAAGQVETALSQYQNLIAQMGASRASSSGLNQQQNLLSQLGTASSPLRSNTLAGRASLESALGGLSAGSGPTASASMLGSPRQDSFSRAAMESNHAGNEQHAAIMEAVSELQRSDPTAYMAILLAAKQKSMAQGTVTGQMPAAQDSLAMQQMLADLQRDTARATGHSDETQYSPQKLPPKKR